MIPEEIPSESEKTAIISKLEDIIRIRLSSFEVLPAQMCKGMKIGLVQLFFFIYFVRGQNGVLPALILILFIFYICIQNLKIFLGGLSFIGCCQL